MKIAVVGAGKVGGALAAGWTRAGHDVVLGVREPDSEKTAALLAGVPGLRADTVGGSVRGAETIVIAANPAAVRDIVEAMGDVSGKVIIDAMNSISTRPEPYTNTGDALLAWTNTRDVVKCFNTTGFENMAEPMYDGARIDMFTAGDSKRGKQIAEQLARDLGFADCLDFGGNDKFELIEKFALCWINLAIMQGQGRNIAFKVLRR